MLLILYVCTDLFLQFQERVEDSEVELLHEGVDVESHLILKELVLQRLLPGVGASALETLFVLSVVFSNLTNLETKQPSEQEEKVEGEKENLLTWS